MSEDANHGGFAEQTAHITHAKRRRYRDAPVAEAIARMHWSSEWAWDITTPGLLYERLRGIYPAPPQIRNSMQADFNGSDISMDSIGSTVAIRPGPQQIMFRNDAGDRLCMISSSDISVHGLPPYEGWENLEDRLFSAFDLIQDMSGVGESFSQLSLRYINNVQIPESPLRFDDYLTISFGLPEGFPKTLAGFLDRAEVLYPDAPVRLVFTWGSVEAPPGHSGFVFDLDLTTDLPDALGLTEARAALNELKGRETDAFESLLKDRLRELFGVLE